MSPPAGAASPRASAPRRREWGYVLPIVLIIVALGAFTLIALLGYANALLRADARHSDALAELYAAEAGVNAAMKAIKLQIEKGVPLGDINTCGFPSPTPAPTATPIAGNVDTPTPTPTPTPRPCAVNGVEVGVTVTPGPTPRAACAAGASTTTPLSPTPSTCPPGAEPLVITPVVDVDPDEDDGKVEFQDITVIEIEFRALADGTNVRIDWLAPSLRPVTPPSPTPAPHSIRVFRKPDPSLTPTPGPPSTPVAVSASVAYGLNTSAQIVWNNVEGGEYTIQFDRGDLDDDAETVELTPDPGDCGGIAPGSTSRFCIVAGGGGNASAPSDYVVVSEARGTTVTAYLRFEPIWVDSDGDRDYQQKWRVYTLSWTTTPPTR